MGTPQNFSLDVSRRCQMLLEQLWPTVSNRADGKSLPLNASFLLAISTPMVNLPMERIWKPQNGRAVGHINDSALDASLAQAIKKGIGTTSVSQAPFYKTGAWRYHYMQMVGALPDLSRQGLPNAIHSALASEQAVKDAEVQTTETFCSILRNGLAHGGILYLNKDGHTVEGAPVQMFCFVSTKQNKGAVVGLHFLRVGMKDYRSFLALWSNWLQKESSHRAGRNIKSKKPAI